MNRQQREFFHEFSRHGTGAAVIDISPKEVALLACIAYRDVHGRVEPWFKKEYVEVINKEFYSISQSDIAALRDIDEDEAFKTLVAAGVTDVSNVIYIYLKNLAALYRRRFKFYGILKSQPFPTVEQIGLRSLLEFGNCDNALLFSWMAWRKLIYDIDNRSAQETSSLTQRLPLFLKTWERI